MSTTPSDQNPDELLRPHTFDGIQEYDKRLPNWWLWTLYGAIAYSVAYWAFYHAWQFGDEPTVALERTMKENALLAARSSGVISNEILWNMSRDPQVVAAGRATYSTTCVSCHMPELVGGIGPNLKDEIWIHGGEPMKIVETINKGVLEKGMPTWGPVLGQSKITEVTAYILSYHQQPAIPKATANN